jgi:hypothetical protein
MEQVYWYCLAYAAKRSGLSFVGPRRALERVHTKRARSYEVFGSLNPQFAAAGPIEVTSKALSASRPTRHNIWYREIQRSA